MFKAVKIELHRAEGRREDATLIGENVWFQANMVLRRWAHTAPGPNGGYDKCDFVITYEDGDTYEGRFDLKKEHEFGAELLRSHVYEFVSFYAGVRQPLYMTAKEYLEILAVHSTEERAEFKNFLDNYETKETS